MSPSGYEPDIQTDRRAQDCLYWQRSQVHKNVWNVFESRFSGSPQGGVHGRTE